MLWGEVGSLIVVMKLKLGFTLIELLIVIVIIGVLAGITLAVINPARQIARSDQGVARGRVAKACLAYIACTGSGGTCTTETEIGLTSFAATANGGAYSLRTTAPIGAPQWVGTAGGSSAGCTYSCTATGAVGGVGCINN